MTPQLLDPSNYAFSVYSVPTFLTTVAVLLLGIVVLVRERKSPVSLSFFLLTGMVSIWLFCFSWAYSSLNEQAALTWTRLAYFGVPFIAPATYQFTGAMLRLRGGYKWLTRVSWVLAAFFSGIALFTDTLLNGMYLYPWGYYTSYGWMGVPFLAFFFGLLVMSMVHYWTEYKKTPSGTHKMRVKSLMIAFGIGYVGSIDYVAVFGLPLYPCGYAAILGFIIVATRAIWKYHLVDITPAFAANEILQTMTDALLVFDRDGIVRVANRAASELFACSSDDLIGKPITSQLSDRRFSSRLADLISVGAVGNYEMEYVLGPFGKNERILNISISTLDDKPGRRVAALCIALDITERKRAEALMRESEERYRTVVEGAAEGIYLADTTTKRFIESNAAFRNMLGYTLEEIRELTMYELVEFDRETVDETIDRLVREGSYYVADRRYRRKDGTYIDVEVSVNLIVHSGKTVLCAVAHDITERLNAQRRVGRQLERLAALRSIDAAITSGHDLRMNLGTILDHVTAQLNVDAAAVLLLNPHTQMLEYAAGRGFRSSIITYSRLKLGDGFAGRAALQRRTLYVSDVSSGSGTSAAPGEDADDGTMNVPESVPEAGRPLFSGEGIAAYYALPLIAKGDVKGVLELFNRSPLVPSAEWVDFAETLAGQTAIAVDNASLFEDLQRSNTELMLAYDTTLEGWSLALDLRDEETEGHAQRVTVLTERLARAMEIPDAEMVHIRRGALLHDIGKMGIPDAILLKPGPLTDEEWEIMRKHPVYAYELLFPISFLRPALDIPYCHHEKWDGTGYPRGLKGEQIPLSARIFAVVDVWDALRSDRPYRKSWPEYQVREYIRSLAGAHFDPKVVEAFLRTESLTSRPLSALELTFNITGPVHNRD